MEWDETFELDMTDMNYPEELKNVPIDYYLKENLIKVRNLVRSDDIYPYKDSDIREEVYIREENGVIVEKWIGGEYLKPSIFDKDKM